MPVKKSTKSQSKTGVNVKTNRTVEHKILDEAVELQSKKFFMTSWKDRIIRITCDHLIVAKNREDLCNPEADVKRFSFNDILNVTNDDDRGFRLKTASSEIIFRTANNNRRQACMKFLQSSRETFTAKDYTSFMQSDDITRYWEQNLPLLQHKSRTTGFALSKVYKDTGEWKLVSDCFLQGLPQVSLVRIMRVQNKQLLSRTRKYVEMIQQRLKADESGQSLQGHLVWHGCKSSANVISIAEKGLLVHAGQDGVNQYGKGCYFATCSDLAARFAATVDGDLAKSLAVHPARLVGLKVIFLATLFVCDVTVGDHVEGSAPVIPESRTKRR